MKILNNISVVVSIVGGFVTQLLGGFDSLLQAIITLIIIDYLTGVIKGVYKKELSSEIGFKGIFSKIMILILIATSVVLQNVIKTEIPIRETVIMFFIANEGVSILENASVFLPIPETIKNILLQLRGEKNV